GSGRIFEHGVVGYRYAFGLFGGGTAAGGRACKVVAVVVLQVAALAGIRHRSRLLSCSPRRGGDIGAWIRLSEPLPGNTAGATQADAAGLQAGSARRVVTRVQEVSILVDTDGHVGADDAVIAAYRVIAAHGRVIVGAVVAGVTQATAESAAV